jgi:hypothetical protein
MPAKLRLAKEESDTIETAAFAHITALPGIPVVTGLCVTHG